MQSNIMECDDSSDEQKEENRTKLDVLSSFILHAPPGAFHEVLDDIKSLVQDDQFIEEKVSRLVGFTQII